MVETTMDQDNFQFFAGMPEELVMEIVEKLDLDSRLSFRKTCRECRRIVDNSRFYIKSLLVEQLWYTRFVISSDDGFFIKWYKEEERSVVEIGDHVLDISDKNVLRLFQKTLFLILFTNRKLVIGKLCLQTIDIDPESTAVLEPHTPVLPGVLKVEKLQIKFVSKENVLKWLCVCDPKTMQKLVILRCPINQQGSPRINVNYIKYDCVELFQPSNWTEFRDNWNNINSFWINRLAFSCVISADVDFEEEMSPSAEQILELKDALLKNTKLCKIELFGTKHSDFEELSDLIGTYNLETERNPAFVDFAYPQSDMKLSMCVTERVIVFRGPCWVEEEDVNNFQFDGSEDEEEEDDTDEEEEEEAPVVGQPAAPVLHPEIVFAALDALRPIPMAQAVLRALEVIQAGVGGQENLRFPLAAAFDAALVLAAQANALDPGMIRAYVNARAEQARQQAVALAMALQGDEENFVEVPRQFLGEDVAPNHAVPHGIQDARAAPAVDRVEHVNVDPMANQIPGAVQAAVGAAVAAPAVQEAPLVRYYINGLVDGINGPQTMVLLSDTVTGQIQVLSLQEALDLFGVRLVR